MAVTQILQNTAATLTFTWYVDGTATDVDAVTIGIVNDDGDTIVAAGTATTDNNDGTYTYAVANSLTGTPDLWTATWTDTSSGDDVTQRIEIVGGWLFTENDARTFRQSDLTSATKYSDAWIATQRTRITDLFEQVCGQSFVPRYWRETLPGSGGHELEVAKTRVSSVIAAAIGGTAQTVGDIDITGSVDQVLHHTTNTWTEGSTSDPNNVEVEYVHGLSYVPEEIRRAALIVLLDSVSSNVGDRALALTSELGSIRLAAPGRGRHSWTGIPDVDAVLGRYRLHTPVF